MTFSHADLIYMIRIGRTKGDPHRRSDLEYKKYGVNNFLYHIYKCRINHIAQKEAADVPLVNCVYQKKGRVLQNVL